MKELFNKKSIYVITGIITLMLCSLFSINAYASTSLTVPSNYTGSYYMNEEYESHLTVSWDSVPGATSYQVMCRYSEPIAELDWSDWYEIQDSIETTADSSTIDGYMQIKVRAVNKSTYSAYTPVITILGGKGIVVIKESISATSKSMKVGDTFDLSINNLENETDIVWTSSKPSVANVNNKGKVSALLKGTTTITATTNGKKYKCKITVKSLTLDEAYKNILKKGYYNYTNDYGRTLTFDINSYLYLDLDQDGTKELLVSNYDLNDVYGSGSDGFLFRYKNGKVVEVAYLYDILTVHGKGLKIAYNKKQKGILSIYHPLMGMRGYDGSMYVYSKGKITTKYEHGYFNVPGEYEWSTGVEYSVDGKEVSKSKYNAYVKKYFKTGIKYYSLKKNKLK